VHKTIKEQEHFALKYGASAKRPKNCQFCAVHKTIKEQEHFALKFGARAKGRKNCQFCAVHKTIKEQEHFALKYGSVLKNLYAVTGLFNSLNNPVTVGRHA
jgi:superfamily II helicase